MMLQKLSIGNYVRSADFKGQKNSICKSQRKYLSQKTMKKFEVNWTWKIKKVEVIPVIIGALGTVSKDFST